MDPSANHSDKSIPLLVTNHHVVEGARKGRIEFAAKDGDLPAKGKGIRVEVDGDALTKYGNPEYDLAAMPIAPILNQLEESGRLAFFRSIVFSLIPTEETVQCLAAIEEVTFVGYPRGLYDERNVSPLVRRGIIATPIWNDFEGKPVFVIAASVFPGSSGSPVFCSTKAATVPGAA